LVGPAQVTLAGRLLSGRNANGDFTYTPHTATCNVGVLSPTGATPGLEGGSVAGGAETGGAGLLSALGGSSSSGYIGPAGAMPAASAQYLVLSCIS
jgi:hypothetical protein